MLNKEDFAVIKALSQHGVYLKDIAAELGVHPKTVKRALQRSPILRSSKRIVPFCEILAMGCGWR
jgi:IS30 family transposase